MRRDIEEDIDVLPKKKKRFRLFDMNKDGKGITKEQAARLKPTLRGFFSYLRRDFGKLIEIDIFLVLGNFPLIFALLAFSGLGMAAHIAPATPLLPTLESVASFEGMSAALASLFGIGGMHTTLYTPTVVTYVLYGLSALVIFTFGLVSVGTTYLIRNMLKGEPVFLWSDFWYAIRRNWKQGLIMGILDVLCLVLLVGDMAILLSDGSSLMGVLVGVIFVFFILYLWMRPYLYLQIVTFDLSLFKMFKNALIFALLGIKRNVMALLGVIAMVLLAFLMLFGFYGIFIPIAFAFIVLIIPAFSGYMFNFAAYFKVKQIMIDPYLAEHPEEDRGNEDGERVAIDRG